MELDFVPSEDEVGVYTPLQRPVNSANTITRSTLTEKIEYSDDDVQNNSSSYDSDEAHTQIVKKNVKRKFIPRPTQPHHHQLKKSKFSVWSDILQEEAIENQFVSSEFFGGSYRGNESYNYKMKHFMEMGVNMNKESDKNADKTFPRKTLKARNRKSDQAKIPLVLPDLDVTAVDSPANIASNIAQKLNEPKTELIERVVNTLGNQKAIDVYNKTKETEKNGGLMILNGARRRTSGGLFLKFVKDTKLTKTEFEEIFRTSEEFSRKNYKPRKPFKGRDKVKTKDLEELPLRYELELSMSNEENGIRNPPPSPVYLSAASASDSSALNSFTTFSQASSTKNVEASASQNDTLKLTNYVPKSLDFISGLTHDSSALPLDMPMSPSPSRHTGSPVSSYYPPSPSCSPVSPTYDSTSPRYYPPSPSCSLLSPAYEPTSPRCLSSTSSSSASLSYTPMSPSYPNNPHRPTTP